MGFFDKLKKINIFAGFGSELTDDFYDELEESLILADTGMDVTLELVEELAPPGEVGGGQAMEGAREVMVRVIADALSAGELSLDLSIQALGGAVYRGERGGQDHLHRQAGESRLRPPQTLFQLPPLALPLWMR